MTSEVLPNPYNGYRRFLPGDCGPGGAAVAAFVESDDMAINADYPTVKLAQLACRSCEFQDQCTSQAKDIARTLHNLGVSLPVVSGIAFEPDDTSLYMTERERLTTEPHYAFDMSGELPDDPLTAAALLRQWMTVQGRLIVGKPSRASLDLTEKMLKDPVCLGAIYGLDLSVDEAFDVIMPLTKLLISHERQDASKSTWGRRAPEDQLDRQALHSLAPLYLEDASLIRRLGFQKLEIVLYHGAEYWQKLVTAYENSHCIDINAVIFHCEASPRYPVSPIEAHIVRNDARRRGTYQNPYRIPRSLRDAEIARLEREVATTHPHITRTMLVKAFNSSSNVFAAQEKVESLRSPRITRLAQRYADQVPATALQNYLIHSDDPEQEIHDYLERVENLTALMLAAGGDIAPSYIAQIAIDHGSDKMTGREIIIAAETKMMRLLFRERCKELGIKLHVPAWTFGRVVSLYPKDEWWDVLTNLNELIETGMLRTGILSCALETEAANVEGFLTNAVSDKGEYITMTVEAQLKYVGRALAVIVRQAKLDLLIHGHELPEQPKDSDIELPVWLRDGEAAILAKYVRQGSEAMSILNGDKAIPEVLMRHYGWPEDKEARAVALSAIRYSALRGDNARRLHYRAARRQKIRQQMAEVYRAQAS